MYLVKVYGIKMINACLTCTRNEELVMITEKECNILDYLLSPISTNFLKSNEIKICVKCQIKIDSIDKFRTIAINNCLQLIKCCEENPTTNVFTHSIKNENNEEKDTSQNIFTNEIPVLPAENFNTVDIKNDCPYSDLINEELVIKPELDDDDDDDDVDDDGVNKNHNKIILENILQNMYVAKPTVTTTQASPMSYLKHMLDNCEQTVQKSVTTERYPAPSINAESITSLLCVREEKTLLHQYAEKTREKNSLPPDSLKADEMTKCDICDKVLSKFTIKRHITDHSSKFSYCRPCDKWFKNRSYNYHLTIAHYNKDDLKYTCDYCGVVYSQKFTLKNHILSEHLRKRPHKCAKCPMSFTVLTYLNKHIAYKHTERKERKRNYVCELCGLAMLTNKTLRDHMVVHTRERPYKCKICGADFGFKAALYTHNKLKHEKKKRNLANKTVLDKNMANKSETEENMANKTETEKNMANKTENEKNMANKTETDKNMANKTKHDKTVTNKTKYNKKNVANKTKHDEIKSAKRRKRRKILSRAGFEPATLPATLRPASPASDFVEFT